MLPSEPVTGAEPAPEEPPGHPLEEPTRLARSLIWGLQRSFYAQQGRNAWNPGVVPFYSTTNAFFVKAYARMVVAFLRDLATAGTLDRGEPVYLVELAAGSGQFAFRFLRAFEPLRRQVAVLEGVRLVYVMTDFAESNITDWARSDRLFPFLQEGRLDLARFDLERDRTITLIRSGVILEPGRVRNPLLLVANYAFDTIRQDAFVVQKGQLAEARVVPVSSQPEPDPSAPEVLARLRLQWKPVAISLPYYGDPVLDGILAGYQERLGDTFFLMPIGAFLALEALSALSNGRLFLLSADKAFTDEKQLGGRAKPGFALHGSSFSMMVNLHAIGRWFEGNGGRALHTAPREVSLRISTFVRGLPGVQIPETLAAFRESIEGFSPTDYQVLLSGISEEHRTPSLATILSLLRLGEWDHHIVFAYSSVLMDLAKTATPAQGAELVFALRQVWEGFFPMSRDLACELGQICLALRQTQEAARYLTTSLKTFGPGPMNLMALGFASAVLGHQEYALHFLDRSLELLPGNEAARALRDRVAALPPRPRPTPAS